MTHQQAPELSPSHDAGEVTVTFLQPEPELVEAVRQGLEAHKRVTQEREAYWIAKCQRLLREGEANA